MLADSLEEAAKRVGGHFEKRINGGVVVFPKDLFTPTKEDSKYFVTGGLLEYKGILYLAMLPDDSEKILHIRELPLIQS